MKNKFLADNTRLHALLEEIRKRGWSSAWVSSPANVYYVTGWICNPHERFLGLYVDAIRSEMTLFVPALDYEAASVLSAMCKVIAISDEKEPFEVIRKVLGIRQDGTVGLEKSDVSVAQFEGFITVHPSAIFTDSSAVLMDLRMVKDAKELAYMEQAVAIAEKALIASLSYIRAGVTELELAMEIAYQLREAGSDRVSAPLVLAGVNSAHPHGHPGQYRLQENDFVMIDLGANVHGYGSDITRTYLLGEGTKEQAHLYEIVREANDLAILAITVGRPYSIVDHSAREFISSQGYGSYFNHRTGHGLGIDIHESPSIHGSCEIRVAPGHLFTVEPGIYRPGIGGVRIEDDIYIEPSGQVRVLTSLSKELQRL